MLQKTFPQGPALRLSFGAQRIKRFLLLPSLAKLLQRPISAYLEVGMEKYRMSAH